MDADFTAYEGHCRLFSSYVSMDSDACYVDSYRKQDVPCWLLNVYRQNFYALQNSHFAFIKEFGVIFTYQESVSHKSLGQGQPRMSNRAGVRMAAPST